MKNILCLSLLIIISLPVVSCKSKKKTTTSSSNVTQDQNTTTITNAGAVQSTAPVNHPTTSSKEGAPTRFVVSFYSIGEGIDRKTHDQFVKFLDTYTPKITYAPAQWGPEGEVDYCLSLDALSPTQQAVFVKKTHEILGISKLVDAKENSTCNHTNQTKNAIDSSRDDSFRLVVSFYSIGEGSDYKVKEEFEKFLNSYSKKIAYEPTPWGREGEIDYCLKLNELSPTEQVDFVKKAKEVLHKSKLVHINENVKCIHKH